MNVFSRKLDNTAKFFSLEQKKKNNTFRFVTILKENVEPKILKKAVINSLIQYPSYNVKLKSGIFWDYFGINVNVPNIEKKNHIALKNIDFENNNGFLFKVTYFNNTISLDVLHILTDGLGASILLKAILYNYFNLKYNLKNTNEITENVFGVIDKNIENADTKLKYIKKHKSAYLIQEKMILSNNKTNHYILDLEKFKCVCKKNDATITEYLTALYVYSIYKTIYNKHSSKDIVVTIPIDLRKHYKVNSYSNFFTCMNVEGHVQNNQNLSFIEILNNIKDEFKQKLCPKKIENYLANDVKLGTNRIFEFIPVSIKKFFIRYADKFINHTTTTLSNIGPVNLDEQYKKYVDNIMVLVSTGTVQKTKCTVCSYENKLNVTINSNMIDKKIETEFYFLLKQHMPKFKFISY